MSEQEIIELFGHHGLHLSDDDIDSCVAVIREALAIQAKESPWISVDSEPKKEGWYFVYAEPNLEDETRFTRAYWNGARWLGVLFTHYWMPIPPLNKDKRWGYIG
jgi:hypothetical protein